MKKYLPRYPDCFVCGDKNDIGLKRRFYINLNETGEVTGDEVCSEITFTDEYVGFRGVIHGGIITALIDETMWWAAVVKTKKSYVTADINVSFLQLVRVGEPLTFKGKFLKSAKKLAICEGYVVDSKGETLVRARGRFFALNGKEQGKVAGYLVYDEDTYDIFNKR